MKTLNDFKTALKSKAFKKILKRKKPEDRNVGLSVLNYMGVDLGTLTAQENHYLEYLLVHRMSNQHAFLSKLGHDLIYSLVDEEKLKGDWSLTPTKATWGKSEVIIDFLEAVEPMVINIQQRTGKSMTDYETVVECEIGKPYRVKNHQEGYSHIEPGPSILTDISHNGETLLSLEEFSPDDVGYMFDNIFRQTTELTKDCFVTKMQCGGLEQPFTIKWIASILGRIEILEVKYDDKVISLGEFKSTPLIDSAGLISQSYIVNGEECCEDVVVQLAFDFNLNKFDAKKLN